MIFTVFTQCQLWKLGQAHQNLIKSLLYHSEYIKFGQNPSFLSRDSMGKPYFDQNLALKIRPRSPDSPSQYCIYAGLVQILVVNPITVYSYGFLFNCMMLGQASDSMMALTLSFNQWVGAWCLAVAGPTMAQPEVSLTFLASGYQGKVGGWFDSICL